MLAIPSSRCEIHELIADILMPWTCGTPSLPESETIEPHFLLCHERRTSRWSSSSLRRSRTMSGPAASNSNLDTSLDNSVFPKPFLSSADAA